MEVILASSKFLSVEPNERLIPVLQSTGEHLLVLNERLVPQLWCHMKVSHWGPVQRSGSYKAGNIAEATEAGQLWVPSCKLLLLATAPNSWDESQLIWEHIQLCHRKRCLQRSFPRGSRSQSSFGFLQSEAASRCPMSPTRIASLGCSTCKSPARQGRSSSSPLLTRCWYLHETPVKAPREGNRMGSCLSSQWPRGCPYTFPATLDLGSHPKTQGLHGAGSMWS